MTLLFLALFASSALANDPPAGKPASVPIVVPVSKVKFIEGFKAGLPDIFCADKTYFRKCFDTAQEPCKKATSTALAACITEMEKEIPVQITQQAEGQLWGDKLGSCAGTRVEAELPKLKNVPAECKDPNRWK